MACAMLKGYDFCPSAFRDGDGDGDVDDDGGEWKRRRKENVILGCEVVICMLLSDEVANSNPHSGDLLRMGW